MTTPNTTPAAPQAAPSAPATTPTTPAASPAPTGATSQGTAPAAPAPQTPAAPAKPPVDTKALIELRKLQKRNQELETQAKANAKAAETLQRIQDPKTRWEAAQDLGLSYQEYTQHVLGTLGKSEPEPVALPPEIAERLAKVDALEAKAKAEEEAKAKADSDKQFQSHVETVKQYITGNAEQLPMTAALGVHESFLRQFLAETQQNEGVPPDDAEFAARFEKQLATTVETQLTAIAASSKGKALLQRLLGVTTPTTANPTQPETAPARTPRNATNGLSAETPPAVDPRTLTPEELRKRASRHFAS
jgi:hypothetical protein